MDVVKVLIPIVVIGAICGLINKINIKKSQRIRQFPMIIFAVIVSIVEIAFIIHYSEKFEIISSLLDFLTHSSLVIYNFALLLGYLIIRLIAQPIITSAFNKREILQVFSLTIYEYDEEYNEWFLNKQWINFRKYIFWILLGLVLASGTFLGLTWVKGPQSPIWLCIFPCVAVLVLNEIYGYVNGLTKEEWEHSVYGDEADARRISNYYKLKNVFEEILPEPLLSKHSGFEMAGKETAVDLLNQLENSDDKGDQSVLAYFNSDERYKSADVDCVQATLDMMHRQNVIFFNPFYKDLGMYLTLPLVHTLLSGKNCIVLCGRKNITEDVKNWLSNLIADYSRMKSLWRVNYLSDKDPECEIGILSLTQIYDKNVLNANRKFLKNTDFVFIIEPSIMLYTGQIALNILAGEMTTDGRKPVICACDRFVDGLVDTLSHVLYSEFTNVVAVPTPRCNYSALLWDADGDYCRQKLLDKQSKYLGNGIEISAIAVKNQIPQVHWYSEKKAPVKDIKWIAGQYYSTLCRYMNLPLQQKNIYEKIKFETNLWNLPKAKEEFVIVEDEFCNMFSIMKTFLSRGEKQVFVNVFSENYLLRDYMRCNSQMFLSNSNSIPSYVPDYSKTERNTILKLIVMMTLRPVSDEDIKRELQLIGIDTGSIYDTLQELTKKYTFAEGSIFSVSNKHTYIDEYTSKSSDYYSVSDAVFDEWFADSLKNAYYILEEEQDEEEYIDAKLFSHVTQTILPGQFVTYAGKYYQAKYVSRQSGVILRRASNLYDRRVYYRQLRKYYLNIPEQIEYISLRTVMDIEFAVLRADINVETTGYLEMKDNHDLRTAKLIDLTDDPATSGYERKYHNKSILRIKLPESDEKICFTICMLLSEIFRSVFPDGWQYLAATTKMPEDVAGMLNYVVYPIEGSIEDNYIYIIEDSDIDLGLLEAVEKNFSKLMEIIADFLEWHFEKMREPAEKDPVPVRIKEEEKKKKKKKNLILRMLLRIQNLFGRKKEEPVKIDSIEKVEKHAEREERELKREDQQDKTDAPETANDYDVSIEKSGEENSENDDSAIASIKEEPEGDFELEREQNQISESLETVENTNIENDEKPTEISPEESFVKVPEELDAELLDDPSLVYTDGTDIFEEDAQAPLDYRVEEHLKALDPIEQTKYQRECYLKYGFEEIDGRIHADELRKYLRVRGWSNNELTLARKREVIAKKLLDTDTENHCDFCGLPLSGVSYEKLNDGRIRCNDCSASAITTPDEFKTIFYQCLEMMEGLFNIQYRVPITARMVDAREVAKGAGMVFRPSTDMAARVLGFAQKKQKKYSLVMENGSPRLAMIDTMVHEMTHIWQYLNWKDSEILSYYSMNQRSCTLKARDIVYEGMAMWASIQYLYLIGETYYASQQEALAEKRSDIYGIGFRLYRDYYPLVKDSSSLKYSPFTEFPPISPNDVKNAVRMTCDEDVCKCY